MKILVTGAAGQLAWELSQTAPKDYDVIYLSRADLDIADGKSVNAVFKLHSPDAVINAAAYTAVDKAESDAETARAVNALGPKNLAEACVAHNAYLLHISTDFVFDGEANRAYAPDAPKAPLGVYGETKAEGEAAIANTLDDAWAVIRTAWVYSSHGANFVKTMLRLMGDKPMLGVVGDQIGTPTWAKGLALVCWQGVAQRIQGTFHWTDAGVASWYDFAVAIQELAYDKGLLERKIPVSAIKAEAYPTPAARPSFSVLDKTTLLEALPEVQAVHWQEQLGAMLDELKSQQQ